MPQGGTRERRGRQQAPRNAARDSLLNVKLDLPAVLIVAQQQVPCYCTAQTRLAGHCHLALLANVVRTYRPEMEVEL